MPEKEISPWDEIFGPPEEKEEKKEEEKEETFFLVEEEEEKKEEVKEEPKEDALLSISEKKEERGEVNLLSFEGTPDRFQERSLESLEETPPPPEKEEIPEFERYLALIHDLISHRYYKPAKDAIEELEKKFPRA